MTSATDNRTTELLPCPLCGGEMSVALHGDEFGRYWWTVQRGHDDATACRCRMFVESYMKFTLEDHENPEDYPYAMELKDRLVRKWNKRHVKTCKITASSTDGLTSDNPHIWFELSCGHSFKLDGLEPPNYCPKCGKKVK